MRMFDIILESTGEVCGLGIYNEITELLSICVKPELPDGCVPEEFKSLLSKGELRLTGLDSVRFVTTRLLESSAEDIRVMSAQLFDKFLESKGKNSKDGCIWKERAGL